MFLFELMWCLPTAQVRDEKLATWEKVSAKAQQCANPETLKVRIERSFHLNDDDDTEVEKENVAQGTVKHMTTSMFKKLKGLVWFLEIQEKLWINPANYFENRKVTKWSVLIWLLVWVWYLTKHCAAVPVIAQGDIKLYAINDIK